MEFLLCLIGVPIYISGAVVTFFILAFTLRGKEFSNSYTTGMHYTNKEAVEEAALYGLMWPAYWLGKLAEAVGDFIAEL